jgi:ATP-dependent helicase/nuclease subunit A
MQNNDLIALDAANRLKALDLQSFIVEAPAGAGKTELLTQRYLKLLAVVEEPEEIIALTFTNKAAAEMRNRILTSLEAAQNKLPVDAAHKQVTRELANSALQHAKNSGWQLLTQPSRLRIETIDAMCSGLARQMPLLSRFGGQPLVTDDATLHYKEAALHTLAQISSETSLQDTVSTALAFMHNDAEKLSDLLANMLAKRDQWLPLTNEHAALDAESIAAQILTTLQCCIEDELKIALAAFPAQYQNKLMPALRFAASHIEVSHPLADLIDWQLPLRANAEDLGAWIIVSNFLLTLDGDFRKTGGLNKKIGFPSDHPDKKEHIESFSNVTELIADAAPLHGLRALPLLTAEESQQNSLIVQAFAKLLQLAAAHLWTVFQAANEVDFVAIAQSAIRALENEHGATDLAMKLDYKISHLLVDEFQDTNPTQMALIKQLTQGWEPQDGRTLFCVGDPMQSIYRFRKADVSLFLQATEFGIGHVPLTPLKLTRNNRSHPHIVDWINNTFDTIFPANDNVAQAAISYRKFISTKPNAEDEGVFSHPIVVETDEDSEGARLIEASYVADLIAQERTKNTEQKIAVLVRSRSHLRELVSEIRRNYPHLKFQALDIEALNERQTVQDALSLTRALLHRADRVHWLALLRAPWCGLTLADLHALAADNHFSSIWQLMHDENRVQTLSADGQTRLLHVRNVLDEALAEQGRMPLRRWLESTWLKLGGAHTLISAGDNRDVQAFFDLVEKLALGNALDFTQLDTAMQKLYAKPDIDANDKLQFLTIHGAKGLEFDCVILPALNRTPRHADSPLMLWEELQIDGKPHLLAAPYAKKSKGGASIYDYIKQLETARINNETARLLYVAATRTMRKLHLIGTVKFNDKGLAPAKRTLLELLWPKLDAEFANAELVTNNKQQIQKLSEFTPKLMRLPAPAVPKILNQTATNKPKFNAQSTAKTQLPVANLAADSGSLAHLYMEMIAASDLSDWPASRINACVHAMRFWLLQKGHAEKEVHVQVANIANALTKTIASPEGAWMLAPRESLQTELSITIIDENSEPQEQRIDLTFIENDTRWIIDYKLTGSDETPEITAQHRAQLERYTALFVSENLPIKTAVFFLSAGKLIEL